jgi:small subunit ribosomal protein S6
MSLYECVFIVRQDLSRADVTRLSDTFAGIITERSGSVVKQEYWGLRNLAYKINKNKKGHYVMLALDAPADAVKEMERVMRINEEVVRMLTVRVDAIEQGPSAILRAPAGEAEAA